MKFKRKKNTRQRGTHTHGCGSKKKRRGAGHRGGRGNAGSGKRGDAKKPSFWKDTKRYGKSGFTSKVKNSVKTINITELQTRINTLVNKGKAKLNNGVYSVDLSLLKIDKLLGAGKVLKKFEIKTRFASKSAVEKVQKVGGKVILPAKKEKVAAEKPIKPKAE